MLQEQRSLLEEASSDMIGVLCCKQEACQRPVVGVLCIDIALDLRSKYGTHLRSYIPASYVKFLEAAGASVVPIWIGRKYSYYEYLMSKVNGVLLPGGAVFLEPQQTTEMESPSLPNHCVQSAQFIYEIAIHKHRAGIYFPLWGTCLGFQMLLFFSAQSPDVRQRCAPVNTVLPLNLTSDFRHSRMFAAVSNELLELVSQPACPHTNKYCVTQSNLRQHAIEQEWRVIATNQDSKGLEFITAVEHVHYPFYATQFHPERTSYELPYNHLQPPVRMEPGVKLGQYMGNFFVAECRKNDNCFASADEQLRHSIHNFELTHTAPLISHWQQIYLFADEPKYPPPPDKEC